MWEPTCGHHAKKRAELLPRADMMSIGYFPCVRWSWGNWGERRERVSRCITESCVRDSRKKGLDARGSQTELLASPLCENQDFHKDEIGCLTGGSWELYMSR